MINTSAMIERIANHKANTAFTADYSKPENLRERKIEGLGIAIAS